MGSNGDFDDLARASSAGTSSGGGGGVGDAAPPSPPGLPLAPPPASPSRDPGAPAASPPPPHPADEDMDEVPDDEGEEPEEEDDYLLEEEEPKEKDDGDFNWDQEEAEYNYGPLEEGEIENDADSGEQKGDDKHWGENLRGSSGSESSKSIRIPGGALGFQENLGQMQDRQAEVIRLMACVEETIKRFYQLEWKGFPNPEKYLSVLYEFYSLVNSVGNGLTSDKLYERSLQEISSGRIISFLRLLTEIEIRTQNISKLYVPEEISAIQFCCKKVRGLHAEAGAVQMRALTYALGIPLRVEIVDITKWTDEAVRVKRLDFFRQSDAGKGRVHIVRSYHSSSTAHKPLKRGSDNDLLSFDGAPMLTLLSRRGHCDILYPK